MHAWPSLAEWGEILSPLVVLAIAGIQALWLLRERARDEARFGQAQSDHSKGLEEAINRLAAADTKLADGLEALATRQEAHEKEDLKIHTALTLTMQAVQKALEAVAPNATAIALLQQTQATQGKQIEYGTDQFRRIDDRFNEVQRGLSALARGETLEVFSVGALAPDESKPRRRTR